MVVSCSHGTKVVDNLEMCYGSFSRPEDSQLWYFERKQYGLLVAVPFDF